MADQQQQQQQQRKVVEVEDEEQEEQQQQQQQQQEVSVSVCSDSAGVDVDVDVDADVDVDVDDTSTNKAARLPRWTRQEILVLIQGKKVAENRVRRGRGAATGSSVEPKWATVSSYCKRHGVNRGAVQCRKRWSNLAGDFKKIKEWESHITDDSDSFWLLRNDIRKDRKLPGFFDREVYDILDHQKEQQQHSPPLLFDSGRNAPPDDALFSDLDDNHNHNHKPLLPLSIPSPSPSPFPAPTPISAKHYHPLLVPHTTTPTPTGVDDDNPNPEIGSASQNDRKRKRSLPEDDTSLLQFLEKNGRILSAQLEAHNINLKLDREDRKEHASSIIAGLNKVADALATIADKFQP